MMKLMPIASSRTALFVLLALLAVALLGSSRKDFRNRDLQQSAMQIANESPVAMCFENQQLAMRDPGVLLRANVIKH